MNMNLCLQQVVVDQSIYIHPVFNLVFRVHDGHNLICSAVASFLHRRLLSLAKRVRPSKRVRITCGNFSPWISDGIGSSDCRGNVPEGILLRTMLNGVWLVNLWICVL